MSRFTQTLLSTALTVGLLGSGLAYAKVSPEEAARLGQDLTPMGAEKAGNADGSIPAWTGKWRGLPPGLTFGGAGTPYPDPYASEKPLFTITAQNMDQYAANLTDGQKALFKRYPDSFKMPVYPSHRDFRVDQLTEDDIKKNALNAELSNDGNDTSNAFGASPFPIPKNGNELILNHTMSGRSFTEEAVYQQAVIYPDKNRVTEKVDYKIFRCGPTPKRPWTHPVASSRTFCSPPWNPCARRVRSSSVTSSSMPPPNHGKPGNTPRVNAACAARRPSATTRLAVRAASGSMMKIACSTAPRIATTGPSSVKRDLHSVQQLQDRPT